MRKLISTVIIALLAATTIPAQDYKVVFDMTSKDTLNQQSLVRQLKFIREANPKAQLEVVIYGQGLSLVTIGGSSQQPEVARLINEQGIDFKVCAVTMKRHNVDKTALLPGVQIVGDGIYEIIQKQQQGWGYIKVAQ